MHLASFHVPLVMDKIIMKSGWIRWARHVTHMEKKRGILWESQK
jgi:hypothetical protein